MYSYTPNGICPKGINFDLEDNKVKNVSFTGGCSGNLKGLSSLIEGMDIHVAIEKLKGIECGSRPTSCPDQLSRALEELLKNK